jgi:hypothetical protein
VGGLIRRQFHVWRQQRQTFDLAPWSSKTPTWHSSVSHPLTATVTKVPSSLKHIGACGAAALIWAPRAIVCRMVHGERQSASPMTKAKAMLRRPRSPVSRSPDGCPDAPAPNRDWLIGHDLRTGTQSISFAWIDRDAEIRSIDDRGCHLTNHNGSVAFGKCVGLNDDRRPRFPVVARRRDNNDIAASHWSFRSRPSNSDTASIQFNASSSLPRSRPAIWAATRLRTDRKRESGTTRRNSRRPHLRRRTRTALIRSAGAGTPNLLVNLKVDTVTRYKSDGNTRPRAQAAVSGGRFPPRLFE